MNPTSISRRSFLKTTGALIVTFSVAPESIFSQRLDGASSNQTDGWIAINADDLFTASPRTIGTKVGIVDANGRVLKNADLPRKRD